MLLILRIESIINEESFYNMEKLQFSQSNQIFRGFHMNQNNPPNFNVLNYNNQTQMPHSYPNNYQTNYGNSQYPNTNGGQNYNQANQFINYNEMNNQNTRQYNQQYGYQQNQTMYNQYMNENLTYGMQPQQQNQFNLIYPQKIEPYNDKDFLCKTFNFKIQYIRAFLTLSHQEKICFFMSVQERRLTGQISKQKQYKQLLNKIADIVNPTRKILQVLTEEQIKQKMIDNQVDQFCDHELKRLDVKLENQDEEQFNQYKEGEAKKEEEEFDQFQDAKQCEAVQQFKNDNNYGINQEFQKQQEPRHQHIIVVQQQNKGQQQQKQEWGWSEEHQKHRNSQMNNDHIYQDHVHNSNNNEDDQQYEWNNSQTIDQSQNETNHQHQLQQSNAHNNTDFIKNAYHQSAKDKLITQINVDKYVIKADSIWDLQLNQEQLKRQEPSIRQIFGIQQANAHQRQNRQHYNNSSDNSKAGSNRQVQVDLFDFTNDSTSQQQVNSQKYSNEQGFNIDQLMFDVSNTKKNEIHHFQSGFMKDKHNNLQHSSDYYISQMQHYPQQNKHNQQLKQLKQEEQEWQQAEQVEHTQQIVDAVIDSYQVVNNFTNLANEYDQKVHNTPTEQGQHSEYEYEQTDLALNGSNQQHAHRNEINMNIGQQPQEQDEWIQSQPAPQYQKSSQQYSNHNDDNSNNNNNNHYQIDQRTLSYSNHKTKSEKEITSVFPGVNLFQSQPVSSGNNTNTNKFAQYQQTRQPNGFQTNYQPMQNQTNQNSNTNQDEFEEAQYVQHTIQSVQHQQPSYFDIPASLHQSAVFSTSQISSQQSFEDLSEVNQKYFMLEPLKIKLLPDQIKYLSKKLRSDAFQCQAEFYQNLVKYLARFNFQFQTEGNNRSNSLSLSMSQSTYMGSPRMNNKNIQKQKITINLRQNQIQFLQSQKKIVDKIHELTQKYTEAVELDQEEQVLKTIKQSKQFYQKLSNNISQTKAITKNIINTQQSLSKELKVTDSGIFYSFGKLIKDTGVKEEYIKKLIANYTRDNSYQSKNTFISQCISLFLLQKMNQINYLKNITQTICSFLMDQYQKYQKSLQRIEQISNETNTPPYLLNQKIFKQRSYLVYLKGLIRMAIVSERLITLTKLTSFKLEINLIKTSKIIKELKNIQLKNSTLLIEPQPMLYQEYSTCIISSVQQNRSIYELHTNLMELMKTESICKICLGKSEQQYLGDFRDQNSYSWCHFGCYNLLISAFQSKS